MATITLTEITPTGGTYAFAAWRLVDGTTRLTYMTAAEFTAWGSIGDPPGKPAVDAVFLMAGGGLPAFNTPTGRPRAGNFWVKNATTREVVLFFGDSPNWGYGHTIADDPGSGQTSRLRGFTCGTSGNSLEATLTNPRLTALRNGTLTVTIKGIRIANNVATVPGTYIKKLDAIIDRTISNHRSVTFDASSHASLVGRIWSGRVASPGAGTAILGDANVVVSFSERGFGSIVLNGTAESLLFNFNGAALPAGLSVVAWVQWMETA